MGAKAKTPQSDKEQREFARSMTTNAIKMGIMIMLDSVANKIAGRLSDASAARLKAQLDAAKSPKKSRRQKKRERRDVQHLGPSRQVKS
jgi:hypothetical protein